MVSRNRKEIAMGRRAMSLVVGGALVLLSSLAAVQSGSGSDTIAGAWNVHIEFDGYPPCSAPGVITADGEIIANACTNLESPGYGQWVRTGNREFAGTFAGLEFAPDGSPIGTYKVRARIVLAKDAAAFSGPFTSDIFDQDGRVILTVTGFVRATRITVESL
jgi:hypothetical protein